MSGHVPNQGATQPIQGMSQPTQGMSGMEPLAMLQAFRAGQPLLNPSFERPAQFLPQALPMYIPPPPPAPYMPTQKAPLQQHTPALDLGGDSVGGSGVGGIGVGDGGDGGGAK